MKVLIDTQVFLWAITDDSRLRMNHREIFLDPSTQLSLSVASVWEMLIKCGLGKLPLPAPAASYILRQLDKNRIDMLAIRAAHLAALESLPPIHRDPFDRMIAAQARAEGMPILTADRELRKYSVKVL